MKHVLIAACLLLLSSCCDHNTEIATWHNYYRQMDQNSERRDKLTQDLAKNTTLSAFAAATVINEIYQTEDRRMRNERDERLEGCDCSYDENVALEVYKRHIISKFTWRSLNDPVDSTWKAWNKLPDSTRFRITFAQ